MESDCYLHAKMEFVGNSAQRYGGAIYIADEGYEMRAGNMAYKSILCAFSYKSALALLANTANSTEFLFFNNTAIYSGSSIYGGWIDICHSDFDVSPLLYAKIISSQGDLSVISSKPTRVCICLDSVPQCNVTDHTIRPLYPEQIFQIEVVTVGQRFGTSPSTVLASFSNSSIKINELQRLQSAGKFCTILNYTIKSPHHMEHLLLTVDGVNVETVASLHVSISKQRWDNHQIPLLLKQLCLRIPLLPCQLGYQFDTNTNSCICNNKLKKHGVDCHSETYTILKGKHMWINATFEHTDDNKEHGVLVHNYCPYDYCINEEQHLDLESPSDQCNFKRSSILCGSCQGNLSQIFGTNRCRECSSMWALLVIPLCIILGLVLVALIIFLNLTVAQGTLNALVFYANVVSANQAIFFPTETTNSFFRWFIAWLNLDVGIELCFINGLDAYTRTWLQFLFPIYIWILVALVILTSRYSTLAAKLSGENAVPALGTLFLLSYTKLLRITITTFSSTQLEYPDGYISRVWLYDGNIEFLEPKHAILFIAAMMLLVAISAPYTLVLFTIQWLQRLPYHCLLSWVWKLKPLFDAHTGLYKEKHRYWPGLLLLVRVLLFVAFSLNVSNNPALNLLIITVMTFCLFAYLSYLGGIHKMTYLNVLEYIFLLNLGVLSVATFYIQQAGGSQESVIKTSVSISFITFLTIILGHVYLKVKSIQKGAQCLDIVTTKFQTLCVPLVNVKLGSLKQDHVVTHLQ